MCVGVVLQSATRNRSKCQLAREAPSYPHRSLALAASSYRHHCLPLLVAVLSPLPCVIDASPLFPPSPPCCHVALLLLPENQHEKLI